MSDVPENLKFTKDHEWLVQDCENSFVVGITDHAQDSLGDVTFVELPQVGEQFDAKAVFGVVESVKAASDLYMPVSGEVVEINEELNDSPESVNNNPYESGWMIRVRSTQSLADSGLLSASAYAREISD